MAFDLASVLGAFDLLGFASILVDGEGRVLDRSGRAAALLSGAGNGPDAAEAGHAGAFKVLAAAAAAAARPADCPPIALRRPRAHALIVHAALVTGPHARGAEPAAILVLTDPEELREPSPGLMRTVFGLTRTEMELAHHLCLGRTLKDVARLRQTSVATIRAQLRGLFAKTRTRRQAELVALLARLPPGAGLPPAAASPALSP